MNDLDNLDRCHNMIDIVISEEAFTIPRTPAELTRYVREAYDCIAHDGEMKKRARLGKEPYKRFLEELLPFSHFCAWKYDGRQDVLCSLTEERRDQKDGIDGIVKDITTSKEHCVQISWPRNGQHEKKQSQQLNERGLTDLEIWDYKDVSRQERAVEMMLTKAREKATHHYSSSGGSTIIFLFDHSLFWDSNPQHVSILKSLSQKLTTMNFKADEVLIMLVFGN